MPQVLSRMLNPDPFVMNEDTVNMAVSNFFISLDFSNVVTLRGKEHGIDVSAVHLNTKMLVESKGSHANTHDTNTVFDSGQMWDHLGKQVIKLMALKKANPTSLLFMANPDIPRLLLLVQSIEPSLHDIGLIQLWVRQDLTVRVIVPSHLNGRAAIHHLL